MGFILTDLQHKDRSLSCNSWNWKPTVELLKLIGIFDEERLELMNYNCGTEVTEEEARGIALFLEEKILSSLQSGERIMLDGTITNIPDDGTFYREQSDLFKNYSASEEWLRLFANFCRECRGFDIY